MTTGRPTQSRVRPPQDTPDTPTVGEGDPFRCTNPLSGPYLVIFVIGGLLLLFAGYFLVGLFFRS